VAQLSLCVRRHSLATRASSADGTEAPGRKARLSNSPGFITVRRIRRPDGTDPWVSSTSYPGDSHNAPLDLPGSDRRAHGRSRARTKPPDALCLVGAIPLSCPSAPPCTWPTLTTTLATCGFRVRCNGTICAATVIGDAFVYAKDHDRTYKFGCCVSRRHRGRRCPAAGCGHEGRRSACLRALAPTTGGTVRSLDSSAGTTTTS